MRNTLIDKLHLEYTGTDCTVPWSKKDACVKEIDHSNRYALKNKYIYNLRAELGVSIPLSRDETDYEVTERAKKYVARTVYGEYADKLQEWLYNSESTYLLPTEDLEAFNKIIKSMVGD